MNRQDRAKQFMPFDALKGLQEALRSKEEKRSRVAKAVLSEERVEEISALLVKLRRGSKVEVNFYRDGHYLVAEGEIAEVNSIYKYLKMGEERIFFDDLYDLRIIRI